MMDTEKFDDSITNIMRELEVIRYLCSINDPSEDKPLYDAICAITKLAHDRHPTEMTSIAVAAIGFVLKRKD